MTYQHWQFHVDQQQIAWAYLAKANSKINTIDKTVLSELAHIIQTVKASAVAAIKGLVIASAKTDCFMLGADIIQFSQIDQDEARLAMIEYGQHIFTQLTELERPSIALIQGDCLGGGLELALACTYRLVQDKPDIRLGLPEVLLGMHPGWGGMVRLPRLIGAWRALPLILSGKSIRTKLALKWGLIDVILPQRQITRAIIQFIHQQPKAKTANFWARCSNYRFIRPILARLFRHQLGKKIARPKQYPAPFAALQLWQQVGVANSGYRAEAASLVKLLTTASTQELIRVFLLRHQLKTAQSNVNLSSEGSSGSIGQEFRTLCLSPSCYISPAPNKLALQRLKGELPLSPLRTPWVERFTLKCETPIGKIKHVHIIGAGIMGGDIAAWCALQGLTVTVQDQALTALGLAWQRAQQLFSKKLPQSHLVRAALDRLILDTTGIGLAQADVVLEAIVEDLSAKRALWQQVMSVAKPTALLATNTSSFTLAQLTQGLTYPERLLGLHFFNPVAQMQLVEVVTTENTDPNSIQTALSFIEQIKRLPLVVNSCPGFVINRILMPYLLESVQLIEEGYSLESIDTAAVAFGMPMGPISLADTVGLDICLAVAQQLATVFDLTVPAVLVNKVSAGQLGKKTQQGFYRYNKNNQLVSKHNKKTTLSRKKQRQLQQRLVFRLLNEAAACLREGVVSSADYLDAGMIFGTGFAPFRGGPMRYAESLGGNSAVRAQLNNLAQQFGPRFTPDAYWS